MKVARTEMEIKEIGKNILKAIYTMIPLILKSNAKHTKVSKISIRTSKSISIPFYPKEEKKEEEIKDEKDENI